MAVAISSPIKTVSIQLPKSEYSFLKALADKMGWISTVVKEKSTAKSEIDLALADVKKGKVVKFDNVEDAISYLNS